MLFSRFPFPSILISFVFLMLIFGSPMHLTAQSNALYFPPKTGTVWQTIAPASLGFCPERIDSLYQFLEEKNTKSFLLLKDGKIVLERYFGTYVQDSVWYWASAGKSLTAFLVGQAQDEGLLDIAYPTSQYLGMGWTTAPPAKEALITLRHQLTMTSGLDDSFTPTPTQPDPNTCTDPECLQYLADAGTRWAYHTGPYRLLQDVIAAASGMTINQFTKSHVLDRTGMKGLWVQDVFYSKARDMARYGLLTLAHGRWENDTLLHDQGYFQDMTHPSQALNKSYGYLWWLNGQASFMVPGLQVVFPGKLIPNAPDDLIAALGKNDQKIHVSPSKGWVVVRQGDSAGFTNAGGETVPILFDNALWGYLNALECVPSAAQEASGQGDDVAIFPNPATDSWKVVSTDLPTRITLYDGLGRMLRSSTSTREISAANLPPGIYGLQIELPGQVIAKRAVKN